MKEKEKQTIIAVLDEASSSKGTDILTPQESLACSRVEKSLSGDKIKCEKPLCNDNRIVQ